MTEAVLGERSTAGLWLGLDALLALPLEDDAKADLWRAALRQEQPPAAQLRLHAALARHNGQRASEAADHGRWGVMERDLGEAQNHYQAIAQLDPERQGTVQRELSNLLGKLISNLHGAVHSEPAPTPRAPFASPVASRLRCGTGMMICAE